MERFFIYLYELIEPYYEHVLLGLLVLIWIITIVNLSFKIGGKIDPNVAVACFLCWKGCKIEECDGKEAEMMSRDHHYLAPKLLIEDLYELSDRGNILSKLAYLYMQSVPAMDKFWSIIEAISGLILIVLETSKNIRFDLGMFHAFNSIYVEVFLKMSYVLISLFILFLIIYKAIILGSRLESIIASILMIISIIIIIEFFIGVKDIGGYKSGASGIGTMIFVVAYILMLITALFLKTVRFLSIVYYKANQSNHQVQ